MEEPQAQSRWARWRGYLFSLVLTLLGLALIRAGWQQAAMPTTLAVGRQAAASPSGRGLTVAGRPWANLGERAMDVPPSSRGASAVAALRAITATVTPTETPVPPTPAPSPTPPRTEVTTYQVQRGDNLYLISERFGISQDTIVWANSELEMDPDLLSVGQELKILPVSGVWHTVKAGETLASIAKRYQVTPDQITGYAPNGLQPGAALAAGRKLIIPDGIRPFEAHLVRTNAGAVTVNAAPEPGRFVWPCNGAVTQYFGKWHLAIDIANVEGTPIYAADAGTVTLAGAYGNMGNSVRIGHGGGYETLYGHMRTLLVKEGDHVARGQQIGEMGSTGKSTGPHVHFIVHLHGGAVNPVRYLPRQ